MTPPSSAFHPAPPSCSRGAEGRRSGRLVSLLSDVCDHRPVCGWRSRTSPTASVLSAHPQRFIALSDPQFKIHGPNVSKRALGTWQSVPKNEGLWFFAIGKRVLWCQGSRCSLNLPAHAFVDFLRRSTTSLQRREIKYNRGNI